MPLSLYTRFIQNRSIEQNEIQIRGSWTTEEDEKLMELIETYGPKKVVGLSYQVGM